MGVITMNPAQPLFLVISSRTRYAVKIGYVQLLILLLFIIVVQYSTTGYVLLVVLNLGLWGYRVYRYKGWRFAFFEDRLEVQSGAFRGAYGYDQVDQISVIRG